VWFEQHQYSLSAWSLFAILDVFQPQFNPFGLSTLLGPITSHCAHIFVAYSVQIFRPRRVADLCQLEIPWALLDGLDATLRHSSLRLDEQMVEERLGTRGQSDSGGSVRVLRSFSGRPRSSPVLLSSMLMSAGHSRSRASPPLLSIPQSSSPFLLFRARRGSLGLGLHSPINPSSVWHRPWPTLCAKPTAQASPIMSRAAPPGPCFTTPASSSISPSCALWHGQISFCV
jgi:hypothetical protein